MTPPDWFLQLLGGAAILALLMMLRPFVRIRRPVVRRHPAPPLLPRTDEMEQRWRTHVQRVMRPGALHVAFNRQSVSMGDDAVEHWRLLIFDGDLPLSTLLERPIHNVLASIQGGQATWLLQVYESLEEPVHQGDTTPARPGRVRVTDVAVVAQQWSAPHLLCPDFPISRIATGTLYARYLAQQDPGEVIAAYRPESSPREEVSYTSYTYTPGAVPPEKRTMIRLPPLR
ncbi:hypothetical protein [Deinococcus hopiensis]|uniref:Uncharacterized protein n=1 Tax=Deinococcus hopiensis KR-140 TaxID=695939 RepID=A0A1W1UAM5_9DEIO|nr:hypothetical protein [Deinococcus hopiensis]SMB78135.1 hypothetical protein SAMN00790413_06500 [Deinococcus hopiensis KR-140]